MTHKTKQDVLIVGTGIVPASTVVRLVALGEICLVSSSYGLFYIDISKLEVL